MKIITGVLIFIGIFAVIFIIGEWIARGQIYNDSVQQERMEYCIAQGKIFDECWLSVYQPHNYQKN